MFNLFLNLGASVLADKVTGLLSFGAFLFRGFCPRTVSPTVLDLTQSIYKRSVASNCNKKCQYHVIDNIYMYIIH